VKLKKKSNILEKIF